MRLSKRCEYGLKAAVRLAARHGTGYVQSRDISDNEALPAKFLESILIVLRSASILESKVGAGGGYRLSRPPEQITVNELLSALELPEHTDNSRPQTSDTLTPGAVALDMVHERIEQAMNEAVGELSLADLKAMAETCAPDKRGAMYYI